MLNQRTRIWLWVAALITGLMGIVNLGLSALAGVGDTKASPQEKGLRYLSAHLSKFYNFKGLHSFKDKFQPQWQPRYLACPSFATLPNILLALIQADSGDRFWDYFKPDI